MFIDVVSKDKGWVSHGSPTLFSKLIVVSLSPGIHEHFRDFTQYVTSVMIKVTWWYLASLSRWRFAGWSTWTLESNSRSYVGKAPVAGFLRSLEKYGKNWLFSSLEKSETIPFLVCWYGKRKQFSRLDLLICVFIIFYSSFLLLSC